MKRADFHLRLSGDLTRGNGVDPMLGNQSPGRNQQPFARVQAHLPHLGRRALPGCASSCVATAALDIAQARGRASADVIQIEFLI